MKTDSLLFKTFKIIEIGRENNSGGDVEVYRRGGGVPPDPDISLQRIPYELRSAAHIYIYWPGHGTLYP